MALGCCSAFSGLILRWYFLKVNNKIHSLFTENFQIGMCMPYLSSAMVSGMTGRSHTIKIPKVHLFIPSFLPMDLFFQTPIAIYSTTGLLKCSQIFPPLSWRPFCLILNFRTNPSWCEYMWSGISAGPAPFWISAYIATALQRFVDVKTPL